MDEPGSPEEYRFRAVAEAVQDAVIAADASSRIVYWSRSAERVFGWSASEVLGQPLTMLMPTRFHEAHLSGISRVVNGGEQRLVGGPPVEVVGLRRDGTEFPVELTLGRWSESDAVLFAGVLRDISDRKRLGSQRDTLLMLTRVLAESYRLDEAAPRLLEELCTAMDWDLGALWLVDVAGEALELAARWRDPALPEPAAAQKADVTSLGRGEGLPGQAWERREPVWLEDVEEIEGFLRSEVVAGEEVRGATALPIWSGSEVLGVAEFFCRARRKPDPALSELLAGVGAQIGSFVERARAGRDLEQAKHEAERANQAKNEFLSRMSHELRTPLNAVLGFAQLLDLDDLDERHRDGVQHILKAGNHLLQLVDEVLDIASIEAGELRLSLEPVATIELVAESVALVRPIAERRAITIETDYGDGEPPWVLADRQRLKQVLLNLLSNAIKYNRERGLVRVRLEQRGSDRLAMIVDDTGPGISRDQQQQLFEPFERLGAEQGSVEGTGLGLALSKRLAEAMGGTIAVDSEPGRGTTMTVELERAAPNGTGRRTAEQPQPTALGGKTVLYIEDNLANVQLVEQLLERFTEVRLLTAMQGNLGLELAREHRPDLILLDLDLPDLPGREILLRLRAEPDLADMPIVVVSADATEREQQRLLAAGAHAYFKKPLDIAEFLTVLDKYLGERP